MVSESTKKEEEINGVLPRIIFRGRHDWRSWSDVRIHGISEC